MHDPFCSVKAFAYSNVSIENMPPIWNFHVDFIYIKEIWGWGGGDEAAWAVPLNQAPLRPQGPLWTTCQEGP